MSIDALHAWLLLTRQKATDGTATAKALDYSLRRWQALTRFANDGYLPAYFKDVLTRLPPQRAGLVHGLLAHGGQRQTWP
ncbi:MAG: family transposase [Rhodoferax sp.]|nr:family transposase [Rhodoferax sp.]